ATIAIVNCCDDVGEHADGVLCRPAEQPGMQIAVRGPDPDFLIDEAAQRRRDGRRARVPHASVANKRDVTSKIRPVRCKPAGQMFGSALLLAFDNESDVHRYRARHRLPGPARLDKGHDLALIVASTSRPDRLTSVR